MRIISDIPAQHFSYSENENVPNYQNFADESKRASRVQICQFEDFNELWKE